MSELFSKSQLGRKLDVPLGKLSSVLAAHNITPDVVRENLQLFSADKLDVVRQLLERPTVVNIAPRIEVLA